MNRSYKTLKDQIQTILPDIRETIATQSIQREQDIETERVQEAISLMDIESVVPVIMDFSKQFVFQPNTELEHDITYFCWAMANNVHRQINTLNNPVNHNKGNNTMHHPDTLDALKKYFNAYKTYFEKETGKPWKPQQKWHTSTIEATDDTGATRLATVRTIMPDKKILVLTGTHITDSQVHARIKKITKHEKDFLLIRNNDFTADKALGDWFKTHVDKLGTKHLVIPYNFNKPGASLTNTFNQMLAAQPDTVYFLEDNLLATDFLDQANEQGIALNTVNLYKDKDPITAEPSLEHD